MVRRLISTAVLVACAGFYALSAAEQATVILTNGERRSGQLVSFSDGQLRVGDQSIPLDQVAVIDFTGGTPTDLELSRVAPEGKGQTAIMRTGHAAGGRFVSVVADHTLVWENGNGTQSQFPLRDVSRIYLNTNSARSVFNNERGRGPAASGTSGTLTGTTIRVPGNQAWTDTGITVNRGDHVAFQASGEISWAGGAGQTATPDGGSERRPNYPEPQVPVGALLGKIGNSAPFAIGNQRQALVMPASGRLMLGVNDNELSDNGGAFSVVIAKQ